MEYLSPEVFVNEQDNTLNTVGVSTRSVAFVGDFPSGVADTIVKISSSRELTYMFGRPTDANYLDFLSAENFLAYSGSLNVVRALNTASENARDADFVALATNITVRNLDDFDDQALTGGSFLARWAGLEGNAVLVSVADAAAFDAWAYKDSFNATPDAGEFHVIVIDATGAITGTAGKVLEVYPYASTTIGSKDLDGTVNHLQTWINQVSQYIYVADTPAAGDFQLAGGLHTAASDGDLQTGWDLFSSADETDVPIMFVGAASVAVANYVIAIAVARGDSIVLSSPELADVFNNTVTRLADTLSYRTSLTSVSFGEMDNNWKYMYDRYNDTYRWIPCNSDVAGLMAATQNAWDSPAGYSRGQLKNTVKLAWNPTKADRDELYRNNVNPIVRFQGDGVILWGDKTLQSKTSAFDRINVRRLFNYIGRTLKRTARFVLFDFNDAITRAAFVNMVKPLLEDIKGKRGIYEYVIICDDTNNDAGVVDANKLVCTVRIKPTKSINWIEINLIADSTSATLTESL